MYLQRLEIQGFKSFANKTVLEFPEKSHHDNKASSVTAIVGPNGSGKSNIVDAIRWVLGEQSAKTLRGKKTDDVIFAGSESKARLGFAEVSLVLNNEDRAFPYDYSEVVITRRVYRDGEGEYLLNKNKVRLFDILMLLAKANFGQKSFSIVGQGMVDHIINISPWERKEFFDEATGVKQYQIKRDQAVNRLNRTRDNLEQTNQIIAELEPRLRLLTKQVKKLEKRQEIEKELRALQRRYYKSIWSRMTREQAGYAEELNVKDATRAEADDKLTAVQYKLAELSRSESRRDIFNNLQKDYNKLLAEKNTRLEELSLVKGKMSLEYVKLGKQNLTWLESKKEEIVNRLEEVTESSNNLKVRLEHKREVLQEKQEQLSSASRELEVLQNNLRTAEADLLAIKSGRVNFTQESVRAVLRQKSSIKGIHGTVNELAKTEPLYEVALSVLAGSRLNAVVVADDETAVRCIDYLKVNKLAPVTFFPLNKVRGFAVSDKSRSILSENGAIGFAVELLSFDPKFHKVYEQIFGSAIVVDTLNNAKAIGVGRERLVTLDGDVFETTGVMKGGYRRRESLRWYTGDDKVLATQEEKAREIAVLRSQIDDLIKNRDFYSGDINDLRVDIQVDETKSKGLGADYDDLSAEKNKILNEISDGSIDPDKQDEFLARLSDKKNTLEQELESLGEKVSAVRAKIDAFNLDEEKKKADIFRLQDEMQSLQRKLNDIVREVNDLKISLARLETKKEDLDKEILQELGPEFDIAAEETETVINVDQVWFEIGKLKSNLDQIGGIDPEIISEHQEVSERYEFLTSQTADLEKGVADLELIVGDLDEVISKQFNASFGKINKAFEHYFQKIFDGGKARLTMIQKEIDVEQEESVDLSPEAAVETIEETTTVQELSATESKKALVQTGIDIYVSPPGKKLSLISALSGGERTMTSLALLCAIIDNNPSPFVVMDEVDAALDEANSERLAVIIQELSYKTQFLLITHNRVLMHVADVLYGVAMGTDGVSKTLSFDLRDAEKVLNK